MEFCSAHWKEPKRAVINMKKISIIFQPSPTLIFEVPCSKFTENLYPYPQMPWSDFDSIQKKGMGSHHIAPQISWKKKNIDLNFFVAWPPNLWVPKIFPRSGGWWKFSRYLQPGVLCHWRMGPSLPGRKKSGSVRAMTTVASVMSSGSWNSNGIHGRFDR